MLYFICFIAALSKKTFEYYEYLLYSSFKIETSHVFNISSTAFVNTDKNL